MSLKWGIYPTIWHFGLVNGFREYMIAFAFISVGYCMLLCCLAEMVSVIAFPGGYYGYARCTVHPFFGYLVGISGLIETIALTGAAIGRTAQSMTSVLGTSIKLEPLWWMIIYCGGIAIHLQPSRVYWYSMMMMSAVSVITLLAFLLGSIPVLDFPAHVHWPQEEVDIFTDRWFEILYYPAIFYYGSDLTVVIANEVSNSKQVIPRVMLSVYASLTVLAVTVIMTTISQAPGLTSKLFSVFFPLAFGFHRMLGISVNAACANLFVPMTSISVGYILLSSRMMRSLAKSGLLPPMLRRDGSALVMVVCSAIAIALQTVAYHYDTTICFRIILHSAFIVHIGMCICYVVFQYRYSSLVRTFRSPFGVPGALLGLFIFALVLTSMLKFSINHIASYCYATWMGLGIIYYFAYGERQQTFNPMEQQKFFKVYLINMNKKRRSRKILHTKSIVAKSRVFPSASSFVSTGGGSSFALDSVADAVDAAPEPSSNELVE